MEIRKGDVILPQGTYSLVQDGSTGNVETIVGPHKVSLADTDKPVVYDSDTRRYTIISDASDAIKVFPTASEGQYLVLTNPVKENASKHPTKGKQSTPDLNVGNKINIPGPDTFALFPGQVAEVLDGHQLKSNEYLIIRVYNEVAAKENLKQTIAKATDETTSKKSSLKESDISIGKLFIIRGIDFSFYIPPTGIEVLKNEEGKFVQDAVTLERLEYCILLDQNGGKRYVQGPSVVFPAPTEKFVTRKSNKIFKAIELNENMGIYIKVIADYEENDTDKTKRIAGEELFITGKEQKIYYPREEHSVIKYGDQVVHYAIALPEGEARYILDKVTGEISMVKGPKMYLPDPRKEVVVNRILNDKNLSLWYPGNQEAVDRNRAFQKEMVEQMDLSEAFTDDATYSNSTLNSLMRRGKSDAIGSKMKSRLGASDLAEEGMERKSLYTKPRSITLDTKYDGVVTMNIWPGFAIQTVKKDGKRDVVIGPKTVMLEYDETLEVLELSTGKPKTDHNLLKTVYLQTKNNVVSDIITVETKDSVEVDIRLSYRVNFLEESKEKWFDVSDYVKLLTQHLRSIVRNAVKKINIEEFNVSATDIIRDIILGKVTEKGPRPLKKFEENGMVVYDVEVLAVEIGDDVIADLLKSAQHKVVRQNLTIAEKQKEYEVTEKLESFVQKTYGLKVLTAKSQNTHDLILIDNSKKKDQAELAGKLEAQKTLDLVSQAELDRTKAKETQRLTFKDTETNIDVAAVTKKLEAIQPGLIEAMITSSGVALTETLAKNLKAQNPGLASIFGGGGFKEILDTIKGTPLEDKFLGLMKSYKELGDNRND
jgi:major vault protein